MQKYFYLILGLSLLSIFCAKKMLPPSPDRFPPHLIEIEPVNRVKINLTFDEEINISKLATQSFTITTVNGESLKIKTLGQERSQNIISLFTEPAKPEQYYLSGSFEDKQGNVTTINNKKFKGSSVTDTFPPKIAETAPKLGTIAKFKNVIIDFNFSEPMDTASEVIFITTPLDKNKIKWNWRYDWQNITFGYSDSFEPKSVVYFILLPTLKDLEGNELDLAGYTFFAPESILPSKNIFGNLNYQAKPFKNGIIVFSNDKTKALAVSDVSGNFSVRLDTISYKVTAIADTNFDNFVDLYAEIINYNPQDTTKPKLNLLPILEGQEIDKYIR